MPRLTLAAMLMPPTAAALCGPGLVLRCMSPVGLEAMLASLQSVAFAALLFSIPISWGAAAAIMGTPARTQ
jgi:ABC-type Mn2+/Zn2+ transport system permease subunit